METSITRVYSRYTTEALQLLASLIRSARIQNKMTTQEVAERAGISRSLLQRIEKGDPKCGIGVMFEVATIVGVDLFNMDNDLQTLSYKRKNIDEKLQLLPKRVLTSTADQKDLYDDF